MLAAFQGIMVVAALSNRQDMRLHCAPAPPPAAMHSLFVLYPLVLCVFVLILARKRKKRTFPYPPGPKGYPVLGNVLDLPMNVPIW